MAVGFTKIEIWAKLKREAKEKLRKNERLSYITTTYFSTCTIFNKLENFLSYQHVT